MKGRVTLILNLVVAVLVVFLVSILEQTNNQSGFKVICIIAVAIISQLVYKQIKELVSNNKFILKIMLFFGSIFILTEFIITYKSIDRWLSNFIGYIGYILLFPVLKEWLEKGGDKKKK